MSRSIHLQNEGHIVLTRFEYMRIGSYGCDHPFMVRMRSNPRESFSSNQFADISIIPVLTLPLPIHSGPRGENIGRAYSGHRLVVTRHRAARSSYGLSTRVCRGIAEGVNACVCKKQE